jgi:DNA-binding Lrp family transcriptional regulator
MTQIDRDLLFLYSENARSKIRDLAKTLKKSPQRLKYTIKLLEKEQIANNCHGIFDYSYFGLILFRVYFKGGYSSEKDREAIIKQLRENPYVVSIYELNGEFDLALEILSPNPSRFNKELKKIVDTIPTLNNYKIILNLVTHIYPRAYLAKDIELVNSVKPEILVGGDRVVEAFNKSEMAVLRNFLENPKIRLTSLARKSDLNIKTSTAIMKDLQKRKIIKGFKYVIDTDQLDVSKFRLFLKLHNISPEREKQLFDYMLKTKEIVQFNKTVGDWDIEMDLESTDKTKTRSLIVQVRQEFKDLIESFNIIEFYKYYKKSYLPGYLFTET